MNVSLSITALYASLLAILLLGLSFNIIRLRFKLKVAIGDGEQKPLTAAIRIHGNFIEYIPLALILLGCYELNGADSLWLHILGGLLFVGRILHAIGLSKSIGISIQRQVGMLLTFLVLLILSIENIRLFLN
tara:strand:- start:135 stop:530 length:396 start_codon:yes stop_codon:yes gene_type:complete